MDGKKCGACAEFFRCMSESSEILDRRARGDECKAVADAPACQDFVEAVHEARAGSAIVERVRDLAHEAQHRGEASELIVASLELAEEFERFERVTAEGLRELDGVRALLEAL